MKKEEADKIYKKLKKIHTDEEIAESYIFSIDMTEEERLELQKSIKNRRDSMPEEERLFVEDVAKKLRWLYQLEDMDISFIESYLRRKKLEQLKK